MTITDQSQAIVADAAIAKMVDRLASRFDPYRVILFGSRARGDARAWSDVDLLVIMPNGTDPSATAVAMRRLLGDLPLTKDIVVTTPEVIERHGHFVTNILRPALKEGKVLHDRRPPSPALAIAMAACRGRMSAMSDNDPDAVSEALRWLCYARDDLRGVRSDLALEPPLTNRACYTSQQVAEKALKAAFVLEGRVLEYTHDLHILRDLLPRGWGEGPNREDLEWLSEWNTRGRYPGNLPDATAADAERASAVARSVYEDMVGELARRDVHLKPPPTSDRA